MENEEFNKYFFEMINLLFTQWKNKVNQYVYNNIGICCDDLKDEPYREYFGNMRMPNEIGALIVEKYQRSQAQQS